MGLMYKSVLQYIQKCTRLNYVLICYFYVAENVYASSRNFELFYNFIIYSKLKQ